MDDPGIDTLYDPKTSTQEAEKELQKLLSNSMNDDSGEIDMRLAVVDGFQEGITLLPHQVAGRVWMTNRERKARGGILADDMGSVSIEMMCVIETDDKIVLEKPSKRLHV